MLDSFFRAYNDPAYNADITILLQFLYETDPIAAMKASTIPFLEGVESFFLIPYGPLVTQTLVITDSRRAVFLSLGINGATYAANLAQGWLNWDLGVPFVGCNPAFTIMANTILQALPNRFLGRLNEMHLWGHSYGGAAMFPLALILQNAGEVLNVFIVTFGSPRVGNTAFQRLCATLQATRWFNDNDPVRFVPPYPTECPSLAYLLPNKLLQGMWQQVQPQTGFMITADGTITETEEGPTALVSVGLGLTAWLTGVNGFANVDHTLREYQRRFAIAPPFTHQVPVEAPGNHPEQPEQLSATALNALLRNAANALAAYAANPPPSATPVVVTVNRTPTTRPYTRRKVDRVWGVYFQGECVAVGPGKRRAGILARRFNRTANASAR